MALSLDNITPSTPMGATIIPQTGTTFKVWAPCALEVYVNIKKNNTAGWDTQKAESRKLTKNTDGYWEGFDPDAGDGDEYIYYISGTGGESRKRDPYARELTTIPAFPWCNCIIRDPNSFPWQCVNFQTPKFHELIIYQLHIGTFYGKDRTKGDGKFLDIINRIEYLQSLGINAIQFLPVVEFPTQYSLGYNGTDYYSPEMDYGIYEQDQLQNHLNQINSLYAKKGCMPLQIEHITGSMNQLKTLIDLCHLYGIAVILDVVYNHAGGDFGTESIWFFDKQPEGNPNNSLYFTDKEWAGGQGFALWKQEVRQFLIDNALFYLNEYKADGFRYDEVSVIDHLNTNNGWTFCQDLTNTLRFTKADVIQNAEYWPCNTYIVKNTCHGGAGFDMTQHDGLRNIVRNAIHQSSWGKDSNVDMGKVAESLYHHGFASWQTVNCVENHDIVRAGRDNRIPALADSSNTRSWYARSRSRVATGILLTASGIPMLFMGQEFLQDKQWDDNTDANPWSLIDWAGFESGNKAMTDHFKFTQELAWLRRYTPALNGEYTNVFHCNNYDRVIAFHRWTENSWNNAVIVASLNDMTLHNYQIGFPLQGFWKEVFNSDVYDNWVNPNVTGNSGGIETINTGRDNLWYSAYITIPANSILVFVK